MRNPSVEDLAGYAVAVAGEVNPPNAAGQPCLGLVVGAYAAQARFTDGGAAYLLCDAPLGTWSLGVATARLLGEGVGAVAGETVAGPGDVTGDGVPDVAVGSAQADQGTVLDAGAVYVLTGPLYGDVHLEDAPFIVRGVAPDSSTAFVAAAGDYDGDGALDLLTGAYLTSDNRGAVSLWRGPVAGEHLAPEADASFTAEQDGDWVGACAGGEDLDGDGLDDVAISAQGDDTAGDRYGAVYIVTGGAGGTTSLADADWKLLGSYFSGSSDQFHLVVGGDLDQDGLGEFLVGSDAAGPTRGASADQYDGAVYQIGGPLGAYDELEDAATVFRGPVSAYNAYASRAANAGDINGDAWDDIAIGGPVWTTRSAAEGAVFVVYGPSSGTVDLATADVIWQGAQEWGMAGADVAPAGDVDGDGCADLLIGSRPYFDYRGHAWLIGGCGT